MDLNTILIILGILVLVALIAHGVWSRRRERSQYFDHAAHFSRESVSPFSRPPHQPSQIAPSVSAVETQAEMPVDPIKQATQTEVQNNQSVEHIRVVLPNQSQPHFNESKQRFPNESDTASSIPLPNYDEPIAEAPKQSPISQAPLIEPVSTQTPSETYSYGEKQVEVSSYITLYVVAAENRQFQLLKLSQALEELGFIFGKNKLFHYHLHLSIDSPVLFSVANINQPGSFDLQQAKDNTTIGVTLFMPLPSVGNTVANLKMMIRAARTLAEELDGFILTDEQEIFTEQAELDYLSRIN
ncbi:MAG: cell division protein ZipA [Lonepinella koalarum]|nr:cell division protein ZipA [Lonepinella koalarum]